MYDALILGAGMSGLAAGIRLAMFGRRVAILERHAGVGGLNSFYRIGGRDYDVGLHALTNYAPKGGRRGPLPRLLRQLRLSHDEFDLAPQVGSRIAFPGLTLDFDNDFALLESEVRRAFPDQVDGLRRLVAALPDYDRLAHPGNPAMARPFAGQFLRDPLLVEMLFCPLLYYGSAWEDDMPLDQFAIMFRAVFLEGFSRPRIGVRKIIRALVKKYRRLGGQLYLRRGVRRLIVEGDQVTGLVLDDGSQWTARQVLSSIGWPETLGLCGRPVDRTLPGRMSFVETISVLDRAPAALGLDRTIVFYNDSPRFHYHRPDELVDPRSGVVCSPSLFRYAEPADDRLVRITAQANHARWAELPAEEYPRRKAECFARVAESAVRFVPDFRQATIDRDSFTPLTVERYTGHRDGAVYGSTEKRFDGSTPWRNLFVCGTDQGFVGIVGALTSGVLMANRHLLGAAPEGAE